MGKKGERRIVRLNSGIIETQKSPYPISDTWEGIYKQRFDFLNYKNNTTVRADMSATEIRYWIEVLEKGLHELRRRMIDDTGEGQ